MTLSENGANQRALAECKARPRAAMHAFHRYYGKLIPAIPAFAIERFSAPGELVFDPFCGSGTVGVEALLHGRRFLGVEINPLAQRIADVKTRRLDPGRLRALLARLGELLPQVSAEVTEADLPFLRNRDHWFRPDVQRDLVRLRRAIDALFTETPDGGCRDFFLVTLSAVIRNVSNADTMHVFPGVSKRMRALIGAGDFCPDTVPAYLRAAKKRIACYEDYAGGDTEAEILCGDCTALDLSAREGTAALCVTNPPYISSVRYIETLKLEMYWMGLIGSAAEYDALAHRMLGNDRLRRAEYAALPATGCAEIDALAQRLWALDRKSGYIAAAFFRQMEQAIRQIARVLRPGGTAVVKISDSRMRGVLVETGRFLTLLAEKNGFAARDAFSDEINAHSRSLTLARNTYSDVITQDYILVWEKRA